MKKIIVLSLCTLLLMPLVSAGTENDPEIQDENQDVALWIFLKGPLSNLLFKHLDILSCWFSENHTEPDTLYVSMKIHTIRPSLFNATYTVQWYYQDIWCYCIMNIDRKGEVEQAYTGYLIDNHDYRNETICKIDETRQIITFSIPKVYVNNPGVGEVLRDPFAVTILMPYSNRLISRFPILGLVGYDEAMEGRDYIIQY